MRPLVICCSQRFKPELDNFVHFLEKRGVLVFSPNFKYLRKRIARRLPHRRPKSPGAKAEGLVLSHMKRIAQVGKLGGICLIFNPKAMNGQKKEFGYIGKNTGGEIFAATAYEMAVIMLKSNEEESYMALVSETDRKRVFAYQFPKANPVDFDFVWENWLKGWLNG